MFFDELETKKPEVTNENADVKPVEGEEQQLEEGAEFVVPEELELEEALAEALELQETQALTELEGSALNEATMKRRKESVRKQRTTMAALGLAKAAGDPMFAKMMQKHREVKEMRQALLRKYEAKAKATVKR